MPAITHEIPAAERIRKARTALLLDHPFFGSLLFRLKGREQRSIPTMATDGVSLYYNPEFVDTLNSATLAGVLAHEVMHPALQHHCGVPNAIQGGGMRRATTPSTRCCSMLALVCRTAFLSITASVA